MREGDGMGIKPIIDGMLFIAVDFDGTITTEQDDSFGEYTLQPNCKDVIAKLHATGKVHFGIWSCRSEPQMKTAKAFLEKCGMLQYFEHFNGDFAELVALYDNPTRKSSADVYIDDRAMLGKVDWLDIYEKLMYIVEKL